MHNDKLSLKIERALDEIRKGRMVVLVDDEDRENEGDLICAAEKITPETINFMATHGRGLICLAMDGALVDQLELSLMPTRNRSRFGTAFTYSIEAAVGVTTGISAADRARTIQVAVDPHAKPSDVSIPGHIFPLRARDGGVLVRRGQTEGSVDLSRLAGLRPAGVICEIINDDGTMSRMSDLEKFAEKHDLMIISVQELVQYRYTREIFVEKISEAKLPIELENGLISDFKIVGFKNLIDDSEHIALVKGDLDLLQKKNGTSDVLVRVHSECLTGDVLGSSRCDCGKQLKSSLQKIHDEGEGVLVYLRAQEGRGIGLLNKIRAYSLQDRGRDTVEANLELGFQSDSRHFGIAAQIMKVLGLDTARLMTNNPQKVADMNDCGVVITERVPLETYPSAANRKYLSTKREKMGHFLSL